MALSLMLINGIVSVGSTSIVMLLENVPFALKVTI
jgi:hypothetical protein